MAGSAREQSQRPVEAALLGIASIAGLAAIGLIAARGRRPRGNGPDRFGRPTSLRRRRPGHDGPEPDLVPVRPDRPLDLSGGAAAAIPIED